MSRIRKWATPITMGAFLLSGVTGILMFFHLDMGLNKAAHEWLGWALVGGVGLHLLANHRAFTNYFKQTRAVAIVATFAVILGLSFAPLGGESGESSVAAVMGGLGQAQVEQVIALTGESTEAGLARLNAAGIEAKQGQTIADLAGGDKHQQATILSTILGS